MKWSTATVAAVSCANIWTSACHDATSPPTGPLAVPIDQKLGGIAIARIAYDHGVRHRSHGERGGHLRRGRHWRAVCLTVNNSNAA